MEPTKKWARWPARGNGTGPLEPEPAYPEHPVSQRIESLGGGWYGLPNGARVRGFDAAVEAFEALEGF